LHLFVCLCMCMCICYVSLDFNLYIHQSGGPLVCREDDKSSCEPARPVDSGMFSCTR
jgi:hypothetical protein